jgi:DNA-binding XRE family transcriptional regulator
MPKGGTIYAIGMEGTSLIKIGSTTTSVERRLKSLQTGQPHPLHILANIPVEIDVQKIERQVHAFLTTERRRGEWFDVDIDHEALAALVVRAVQFVQEEEIQHSTSAPRTQYPHAARCGQIIRALRKERKITLQDLAKTSGVVFQHLSRIERGESNTPIETLANIAQALDVPLQQLFPVEETR